MSWIPRRFRERWQEVVEDAALDVWARSPESFEDPLPIDYPGGDEEEVRELQRLVMQSQKRGQRRWIWRGRVLTALYAVFSVSNEIRWRLRRGVA